MSVPLTATTLLCGLAAAGCSDPGPRAVDSRSFEVRYVAHVRNVPAGAKQLRLWVPLPQDNPQQRITRLRIVAPAGHRIVKEKKHGNRMLFLAAPNPPAQLDVEARFDMRRFENGARYGRGADAGMKANALRPSRLVPLSGQIRSLAESIIKAKKSNADKARALYEHVIERMVYDKSGTGRGRGDFGHACSAGRGNCSDYHAYFIGLCRNVGIPAFLEIGLSVPAKPAAGSTGGYHCWAYFWDGGQWIPVDISEADKRPEMREYFFGNHCRNRVALAVGRDIVLEPLQKGGPLNFFIYPYAEVDGKPHTDVVKESSYRDLAGATSP